MKNRTNGKKKSGGKARCVTVTRKDLCAWLGLAFVACALMFFLGILVGRGDAPAHFDIDALQKDLAALKNRKAKEQAHPPADISESADKSSLEFYEKLAAGDEGQTAMTGSSRPKAKPEHKISRVKAKKNKQALKTAARKTVEHQKKITAPAPAEDSGGFTIQVAAVKEPEDARRLVARLLKSGYPAYQYAVSVSGGAIWHRVRVGPFKQKAAADAMLSRLKKDGTGGFVVVRH